MRIHINLKKALAIVTAIEEAMQMTGVHVHGLSGAELGAITAHAVQEGESIQSAVKKLGLEVKAAATSPEVTD